MRVALISFHGCPLAPLGEGKAGGMNVCVRQLAWHLGRLGMQVDLFTRNHGGAEPRVVELGEGVRLVHLDGGPPGDGVAALHSYLPPFLQDLRRFQEASGIRYQVVHAHYWLSGWVGSRVATEWGVPLVVTFHTLARVKKQARAGEREPPPRATVEKGIAAQANLIIATSPHEREALVRLYGTPPHKVEVVPCGVDLSLFRPMNRGDARERLGLGTGKVLLYVGRIEPLKGLELLLRTAAIIDGGDSLRVLIVGGDSGQKDGIARLRALSRELGIEGRVDFVGRVAQGLLPLYYSAADVCVVPSYYESFGLVALEAMACGTPVVASRVGGLPWVIQHSRTGYLVPWHCPEPFANCLEALLASPELRRSMGLAARQRAQTLGWEEMSHRIAGLYQSLAARNREKAGGG